MGTMRVIYLLITGIFFLQQSFAQVTFPEPQEPDSLPAGAEKIPVLTRLDVHQDTRVEKMLKWHVEDNKKRDGMEGFRVEIFSSSGLDAKERAEEEKVKFLKLYPGYHVHVIFSAPVFKVRTGDFRTKNEALKLLKMIQKDYPGAFIVPGIIDFPVLKKKAYERSD